MHAEKETIMSYKIDLKSLPSEKEAHEYLIDDHFFDNIDNSIVRKGRLNAVVEISQVTGDEFRVLFRIGGKVFLPCDLCLDEMEIPVDIAEEVKVKFGKEAAETDTHIIVPENEGILDVAPLIYDYIVLSVPIHHVHPQGYCNESMAEQLKKYLVSDDHSDK